MTPDRLKFCSAVAKLTQPDRAEEAVAALVAMLPMLADVDDRAFTNRECLNRVVTIKRRTIVPAYADVREAMTSWLKDNAPPALPSPDEEPWARKIRAEREQAVADWSDVTIIRRALLSLETTPMKHLLGKLLGALVYRHAPQNLCHIPPEWHPEVERIAA